MNVYGFAPGPVYIGTDVFICDNAVLIVENNGLVTIIIKNTKINGIQAINPFLNEIFSISLAAYLYKIL